LVDRLASRWKFPPFRRVPAAREAQGSALGREVTLIKPQTYMNRSGAALASLRSLPGFDPAQDLLVVTDDFALPLGKFRLRGAGTAGGHNGLKSIEGSLRRQDYARLRIGIGPLPPGTRETADFVLEQFPREERAVLDELLEVMCQATECWLADGIELAMNRFNGR
jgi:PTH1 family peptidyl-tRNA hydrolase